MKLGLIKSVVIRIDGNAKRGKRLVELDSVRKLLASQIGNSSDPGGPSRYGRKRDRIAA
jgi:hypothetical protein